MKENKVMFSAQNTDFVKELREKVKNYFEQNNISKYGNTNLFIKSLFMTAIYVTPFVLMLTGVFNSLLLILLSWFIMGLGVAGIGMGFMHDANHGSFSKYRLINKILGMSLFLLGGFPANWRHQHNTLHHGFTNVEGHDEDIAPLGILRFSPHKPLFKIHRFQHIYAWFFYSLMTLSWVTLKDFKRFFIYKNNKAILSNRNQYGLILSELIISKIVYYSVFLALPIIMLPLQWYWIVLFFLLMHFVAGIILSTIFQTAHVVPTSEYPLPDNNGNMEYNWAVHQLFTTSDFSPKNKLLTWLIGGLNFQVVHHLFPNISHVHYSKLAPLVAETAKKYELPYHVQHNFSRALFEHGKMLRILGKVTK